MLVLLLPLIMEGKDTFETWEQQCGDVNNAAANFKVPLVDRYVAPDFKVHFCRTETYQTLRATHPTGATLQCIAAG